MTFISIYRKTSYILACGLMLHLGGCAGNTSSTENVAINPLGWSAQADSQRSSEAVRVEEMARYRTNYELKLEGMVEFYTQQGNHLKAQWARQELQALRLVPRRAYLVTAEVAGANLRPENTIIAADEMYNEAVILFNSGRGSGLARDDQAKMTEALDLFDKIIAQYPSSDKIDDAAYMIGEIYSRRDDYYTALIYYQRVWQWNPGTQYPVRYKVARIYDDKLNDATNAMKFYELAVQMESSHAANTDYARRRLEALATGR